MINLSNVTSNIDGMDLLKMTVPVGRGNCKQLAFGPSKKLTSFIQLITISSPEIGSEEDVFIFNMIHITVLLQTQIFWV